ncbi:MAG TPA: hypothetical protein VFI77_08830 [Gemmatimonadales bacterium]|nr:hypothetical protein [Gemmatimonadales bacterium]
MDRVPHLSTVLFAGLLLTGMAAPLAAQDGAPPPISQRQFTGGSAKVTVTGSFTIDQEIAINTQASFGDGGSTWLQFGVSGAAEPNILITYGETGVIVGKEKWSATGGITPGEKSDCAGTVKVTPTLVSGEYTCRDITSYQPGKGMAKVDIKVAFSARS